MATLRYLIFGDLTYNTLEVDSAFVVHKKGFVKVKMYAINYLVKNGESNGPIEGGRLYYKSGWLSCLPFRANVFLWRGLWSSYYPWEVQKGRDRRWNVFLLSYVIGTNHIAC